MQPTSKIDDSLGLCYDAYAWAGIAPVADTSPCDAFVDALAIWPWGAGNYPPLNCAISAEWARQGAAMTGMLNELEGPLQEFGNW